MESFSPEKHVFIDNLQSVEQTANFEGSDTEIMLERAKNPAIREQIINLLCESERRRAEKIRNTTFTPFSFPDTPNEISLYKDEQGNSYTPEESIDFKPRTKEVIEKELDEVIEHVSTVTEVDPSSDSHPHEDSIALGWKLPTTDEKPTLKQMDIVVAHEKGHRIRQYQGLEDYFANAFDQSRVVYTEKDFEFGKKLKTRIDHSSTTLEEMKKEDFEYLFSTKEIAERMAQLKNYFGMKGTEQFTKPHLAYAREHYIQDTGMDNHMTHFFQAITPETEDAFIELINSSGI